MTKRGKGGKDQGALDKSSALDALQGVLGKVESKKRRILLIELRSSVSWVSFYVKNQVPEKERKRAVKKVVTNAMRLFEAIQELDDDAVDFIGYLGLSGEKNAATYDRRKLELRGHAEIQEIKMFLKCICENHYRHSLPARALRFRPEFIIARDVVQALERAGVTVSATDTGPAADCFRAVAEDAGISASESPRYWIRKAKSNPEI